MAFEGMDTDAVRSVSQGMNSQAQALEQIVATVDHLIDQGTAVWDGPDVHDFRNWWMTQHRPRLTGLMRDLSSAGSKLAKQVVDQEAASGESRAGRSGQQLSMANLTDAIPAGAAGVVGGALGGAGLVNDGLKTFGKTPIAERVVGPVGAVSDIEELRKDVANGDYSKATIDAINVAGDVAPPPIALGLHVFTGFAQSTIPIGSDAQDSLLNYQSQRMFGAPMDQLSPAQSRELTSHYSGVMGAVNLVSDKMDQTDDQIVDKISGAGSAVGGWLHERGVRL